MVAANIAVADQEKTTAEVIAVLAVTEVAAELATKQAADKAATDAVAAGDEDTEKNNNNNDDTNNHINDDSENVFNSGRWSKTEIAKCAQSLHPNGHRTSYVTIVSRIVIFKYVVCVNCELRLLYIFSAAEAKVPMR